MMSILTRKLLILVTSGVVCSTTMFPGNAITSLSELRIPEEQVSAVRDRFTGLSNTITPLIERTSFAREEFLRMRAERNGRGAKLIALFIIKAFL